MMVLKLKISACMPPVDISIAVHSRFSLLDFLQKAARMLWLAYALGTRTELWFGHGCSGQCMLLEHERNYGLGMDALVSVCSLVSVCFWNAIAIMVWAWMLWSVYAPGTRTELWLGHGCSG